MCSTSELQNIFGKKKKLYKIYIYIYMQINCAIHPKFITKSSQIIFYTCIVFSLNVFSQRYFMIVHLNVNKINVCSVDTLYFVDQLK